MKEWLKKLGFRKMDEMEQHIAFKAQRNAYLFLIVALFAWSLWESRQVFTQHTQLNLLPSMLLCAACMVQSVSQLMMSRNAVKDDEEARTSSAAGFVVGVCIAAVVLTVAAVVTMIVSRGI